MEQVINFNSYKCNQCPYYENGLCARALKVFAIEVKLNKESKCLLFCDDAITEDI